MYIVTHDDEEEDEGEVSYEGEDEDETFIRAATFEGNVFNVFNAITTKIEL